MKPIRRDLLVLFLATLTLRLATAALIQRPGTMDAAYYAAGAVWLSQGQGLGEPFIWNYMDNPHSIPHSGFLYWMPLPSLVAWPFATLFPGSFLALQLPFALLSALLAPITYVLAWQQTGNDRERHPRRRLMAWGAALLVVFSGFFLPYWTLPETFAPFALCGSLVLMLGAAADGAESLPGFSGTTFQRKILRWVAVGLLAGCGHLTRADGVLLLLVVLGWLMHVASLKCGEQMPLRSLLVRGGLVLLGYMFVMGPWFLRNWTLIGRPLGAGGTKTLWLTHYDELFGYGADISLQSYLAWGWGNILRSKLWALGVNLQRFLAENCLVFLFPFTLVGFYRWRRQPRFMLTGLYTLTIFAVHSLVFTFAGPRGSFFHASAATLPFTAVAGVEGIYAVVGWAARRRRWPLRQAQRVFGGATVVAAVLLSGYATVSKVIEWQSVGSAYIALGDWLDERGDQDAIVMIANPPALWYHTRHSAVAVPNGDVDTLLHVIRRYEVSYVALDRSCPADLMSICTGSASDPALGDPVLEVDMLRVFAVEHHWRASRDG